MFMAGGDVRLKLLSLFVIFVLSMGFYQNIISIEQGLGTKNILLLEKGQSTESSQDALANVSFVKGGENLSLDSVQLSLISDGEEYPCMVGGVSSREQSNGTIQSKLNADGRTFTINIDSTSEDTHALDLFTMGASEAASASISFKRTDVFLGQNITGVAVQGNFNDVTYSESLVFDESSEKRLEWYEYDFAIHQIIPNTEVYIVKEKGLYFKIQFLSYYNSNDESRHVTLLAAPLEEASIPALVDESMVRTSPCSIVEDGDGVWGLSETITLQENNISICSGRCSLEIRALYLQQPISGDRNLVYGD